MGTKATKTTETRQKAKELLDRNQRESEREKELESERKGAKTNERENDTDKTSDTAARRGLS
jgi:hypothetical protein